jgi:putative hydrolase of the HAD superfamily
MNPLRSGSPAPMAVWTDFGGVLTPSVEATFNDFSDRCGVPLYALKEAMRLVGAAHGTDTMGVIDIPLLDEAAWSYELEKELGRTFGLVADLSDFGDHWFAGHPVNSAWVRHLAAFRERGAFVGLLSNLPPSWERHRRLMAGDSHFDAVVCSHAVGSRKPEPEIFRIAAQRAGLNPHRCVLVDDLEQNCAGAVAAGWQAVLFRDAEQAARQVGDLLDAAAPLAVPLLSN